MATPRHTRFTFGPLFMLAAVVLILYFAREIFVPLALALTLSFVLTPLVTLLQRARLGRVAAVLIVVLLSVGGAAGVGYMVGAQLLEVANDLPGYRDNIRAKIAAIHAPAGGAIGKATQAVKEIGKELSDSTHTQVGAPPVLDRNQKGRRIIPNTQTTQPTPVQIVEPENDLKYLKEWAMPALKPLGMAGVVLVFTVFILIKREDLRNRVLRLAGLGQLNLMTQALDDGAQRISRYLMMQFLVNAAYGLVFGLGLFFIGVPNALLWGVIAGVLRIIPYVGALTAAALPFVLALAEFNTWLPPVLVVVLYVVLEGALGNFIEPWLYGAHTGVSSLALLLSTVFWTILWGWAGLILSTPLTVCVILLGRYVPHLEFLHVLLGDEAPLTPDAQFYQRLLAMDSSEARTIAETYLKEHPLVDLYDTVFIPALAMAEQDRHKGALDETRETFIFLSTGELVAELADHNTTAPALVTETSGSPRTRIIALPAHDAADEITAGMLAQLAEQQRYSALAFPAGSPWEDSLKPLSLGPADVVCIAALPPFAFTHARKVCQRVRSLWPNVRIIVAIWGFGGDTARARERFGGGRPDRLLTTMAATVAQIADWEHDVEPEEKERIPA